MADLTREALHSDAENYDVFCERCQRVHRHFTFTREDYDRVIAEGVEQLREAIDAQVLEYAMNAVNQQRTGEETI